MLRNLFYSIFKSKNFLKAINLTLKKGPGCLSDQDGRIIHLKTEYIIKLNSLLIFRDLKKFLKPIINKKILREKIDSIKFYSIWRLHIINYPLVHFCVLLYFNFNKLNNLKNQSLRKQKKIKKIKILKILKILKIITLINLPFEIFFHILRQIKLNLTTEDIPDSFIGNKVSNNPKFAFFYSSGISNQPRQDLYLYQELNNLGIKASEPIVVFHGEPTLTKSDIKFIHQPGYLFCNLPYLSLKSLIKFFCFIANSTLRGNFSFWIYKYFSYEFNLQEKYIRFFIDKYNIKIISSNNYLPECHILYYISKSLKNQITTIKRQRSVQDNHDKWSRNFFSTNVFATLTNQEENINVFSNKNFYLPYKINLKNYELYSASKTKISSCRIRILVLTSNFSLNKDPFGPQFIHPLHIEKFLKDLLDFLIENESFGFVFKCKKIDEYNYLKKWIAENKRFINNIDILFISQGIPLLELTKGYHHFISLSAHCTPSTLFELSSLIPKKQLSFVDFSNIYKTKFYINKISNFSNIKKLNQLPFRVHSTLSELLIKIKVEDYNLERKFKIKEYNSFCDSQMSNFINEF